MEAIEDIMRRLRLRLHEHVKCKGDADLVNTCFKFNRRRGRVGKGVGHLTECSAGLEDGATLH